MGPRTAEGRARIAEAQRRRARRGDYLAALQFGSPGAGADGDVPTIPDEIIPDEGPTQRRTCPVCVSTIQTTSGPATTIRYLPSPSASPCAQTGLARNAIRAKPSATFTFGPAKPLPANN